jgi:hypothetical protein
MPINRSAKRLIALVLAGAAVAGATEIASVEGRSRPTVSTDASVLRSLTPTQRQYVTGIASLTPEQLRAAFGTDRVSGADPDLTSLTPRERRYVRSIASMSYVQLAADYGGGTLGSSATSDRRLTQSQQAQLESYQQAVANLFGITPDGLAGRAGGSLTLAEIKANSAALFDGNQPRR